MKPLPPYQIRDLNREIEEKLAELQPMRALVVVKSFKKGKCYGIGFNDPEKDLILRNFARMLAALFRPKPPASAALSISLTDITNTARTVKVAYHGTFTTDDGVFNYINSTGNWAFHGVELAFGNPATPPTPTRTDYELVALVARFPPSSTAVDETNWRVTVTGSYVWTDGGTVRETGMNAYWGVGGVSPLWFRFLLFHDAVSDVSVPPGGTVSVTYTIQL